MPGFNPSEKHKAAQRVMAGPQTHTLLYGGSGSGKTFLILRAIVMRALKAAHSRHAVMRFRFNHARQSIGQQTLPAVLKIGFSKPIEARLDTRDWFWQFENGSQVWLGGLDDKERTEKILGHEYVTLYLNECSQIPLAAKDVAITRLRQLSTAFERGKAPAQLRPRVFYDCNPPTKAHWTYRLFMAREDIEGRPLAYPNDYAAFGPLNPEDNIQNLSPEYIQTLEGLPARERKRFLQGLWGEANPDALWSEDTLEKYRVLDTALPDMQRIIVGVDPSGSGDEDNVGNDEIGIVVVGLGTDGRGYVSQDCSLKGGPATWGHASVAAFERHNADKIVGEVNYGGEMVRYVIQSCAQERKRRIPFHAVTASRGKVVRAEPIASLFEQGQIRMVGYQPKLEQELLGFNTNGYTGQGSPNRADAMIWACHELFPGLTRPKMEHRERGVVQLAEM